MDSKVDVVVLGDGPAGSVAALTLAESGARVLLLGSRSAAEDAARTGQCLPAQGWTWMRTLGLADTFRAGPHSPILANRAAWAGDEIEATDLILGAHGHSWLLDRSAFDALLRDAARARGVEHRACEGQVRLDASSGGWRIGIRNRRDAVRIDAGFAIDASGRASVLGLRHGASRRVHDRLVGMVARFASLDETDLDQTTLVEAVEDGWWYTCRLAPRRRVAIFFTDGDLLPRGRTSWAPFASDRLGRTRHVKALLDAHRYGPLGPPRVVLANSARLDRPAGPRWIAAGDAAASFDPLCGHGLIAALDGGRHAAATLVSVARGEAGAARDLLDTAAARYDHYLHELRSTYAAQPRWSSSRFWARRRTRAMPASWSETAPSRPISRHQVEK